MARNSACFVNFEGGVGNTTVAMNVVATLGRERFNKKNLLIDTDAQANASISVMRAAAQVLRIKRDVEPPSIAPSEHDIKIQAYSITLSFSLIWNAQSKDPAIQNFVDFSKRKGS